MTFGIFGGVIVRKLLHTDTRLPLVRALGIASIVVGELFHILSCYLLGISLTIHAYIYSFGNVCMLLWHLVGRVARFPLTFSTRPDCIGLDLVLSDPPELLGIAYCHLPPSRSVASCLPYR